MQIVVLMGPPAAGKGTHAAFLEQQGFFTFSTGHYIREQAAKGDPACIEVLEKKSKLASDDLVIGIIVRMLAQKMSEGVQGIVLDGFPRTVAQAEKLEQLVLAGGHSLSVIEIVVPEADLESRRQARVAAALAKGEKPRDDDTDPAVFQDRINEYKAKTLPVTPFYQANGRLRQVDGRNPIEVVRQAIFRALGLERAPAAPAPAL